jgi:HEAT repeat protein
VNRHIPLCLLALALAFPWSATAQDKKAKEAAPTANKKLALRSPEQRKFSEAQRKLKSLSGNDRALGVKILGSLRSLSKQSAPLLLEALKDKERQVRQLAAKSIELLGSESQPVLAALLAIVKDKKEDWRVRTAALKALGTIGSKAAAGIQDFVTLLVTSKTYPERKAAGFAIGAMGLKSKPFIKKITPLLSSKVALDRELAALTLKQLGPHGAQALSQLMNLFLDKESRVRVAAIAAVGAMAAKGAPATDTLTDLLSHKDWQVQESAARALGAIGKEARSVIPILENMLRPGIRDQLREAIEEAVVEIIKKSRE